MPIILDCFGTMVLFVTPTAVELSVWIGLCGCGHPMSIRVCWWGTILQAAIKSAASLASAAEARKFDNGCYCKDHAIEMW